MSDQNSIETTRQLLERIRSGDDIARERLANRFLPGLRNWAAGKIPSRARGLFDTDDVVQISLVRALSKVDNFDPRRTGAFLSYLHQILINCIRSELRRVDRRPRQEEFADDLPEDRQGVLEATLGAEVVDSYQAAMERLPQAHQEAIVLRIEFGFSYPEIARVLGRPSPNAARMEVTRALVRLAEFMSEDSSGGGPDEPSEAETEGPPAGSS